MHPADDGPRSRGGGERGPRMGRAAAFPSTNPDDLRVTVYDPLRAMAELEVIKSKEELRHG